MEKKTIKWIKEPEGKKPGSVIFTGEDIFYTIWSTNGKQKGDTVVYEVTKRSEYQGKPQITIAFSDTVPDKDINADIQPQQESLLSGAEVVSHINHTQISIESQSILQRVEGTLNTWITPETPEEVVAQQATFLRKMYVKEFKGIKEDLVNVPMEDVVFDENGMPVEPF